jgi:predicted Zn-dependent peptidase
MYEDEPQDRVHDVLAEAIWGDHPLGRRVLGEASVIAGVPRDAIAAYHSGRYTAENLVVSAAGHLEHAEIVELARRHLRPGTQTTNGLAPVAADVAPRIRFQEKETEQYHICFGGQGIARSDERRFALGVLDAIFGGSTSSRLFREIREKRGLAYSVGSYTEQYVDGGLIAMYVGTREENVAEACDIIGRELARLHSEGATDEELVRAKEHVKGRMVLAMESTGSRMTRLARSLLFDLPVLSLDEMLERVDAVTGDHLAELGHQLYAPDRLSAACIGASEDRFRGAVASVSEQLAA